MDEQAAAEAGATEATEAVEAAPAMEETAAVEEAVAPAPVASSGVLLNQGRMRFGLEVGYASLTGAFDANGDRHTFGEMMGAPTADISVSSMVFVLSGAYGIMDGLEVGVDLPLVNNGQSGEIPTPIGAIDVDNSLMGLGDISVHAAYEARLQPAALGAKFAVKLPLGAYDGLAATEVPVGSGQTDVGVTLFAEKLMGPAAIGANLGYVLRLAGEYTTFGGKAELDPGDVIFVGAHGGYWFGNFGVDLAVDYFTAGEVQFAGTAAPNSDSSALTVTPSFAYRVNPMMEFGLAVGLNRVGSAAGGGPGFSGPSGLLHTGFPIMGVNDGSDGIAASVSAKFNL